MTALPALAGECERACPAGSPTLSAIRFWVLVCCPNLTVKERLQVVRPERDPNYYAPVSVGGIPDTARAAAALICPGLAHGVLRVAGSLSRSTDGSLAACAQRHGPMRRIGLAEGDPQAQLRVAVRSGP